MVPQSRPAGQLQTRTDDREIKLQADVLQELEAVHVCAGAGLSGFALQYSLERELAATEKQAPGM